MEVESEEASIGKVEVEATDWLALELELELELLDGWSGFGIFHWQIEILFLLVGFNDEQMEYSFDGPR